MGVPRGFSICFCYSRRRGVGTCGRERGVNVPLTQVDCGRGTTITDPEGVAVIYRPSVRAFGTELFMPLLRERPELATTHGQEQRRSSDTA